MFFFHHQCCFKVLLQLRLWIEAKRHFSLNVCVLEKERWHAVTGMLQLQVTEKKKENNLGQLV